MTCGTCYYWRLDHSDNTYKCYHDIILGISNHSIEVDPWDQVGYCADWKER